MALTYLSHLQPTDVRRRVRRKNAPTHFPTVAELRDLLGHKAGDAIAQMKKWGYGQVTLNIPQNRVSVVTERGRLNFQFLPQDAIVNRIEWEGPREVRLLRKEAGPAIELVPSPGQPPLD
ncbi:MAG: hypothetical protein ACP5D7_20265 [Limnospira sp.]